MTARSDLLTESQAAARLGIGTRFLSKERGAGRIPHYRVAGRVKYSIEDCDAYLASCRVVVAPLAVPEVHGKRRAGNVVTMRPRFSEVHG